MFYRTELYSDVPQDEAENWIRLAFLLINKGTPCLRKIIRDWVEENDITFDILLDQNKRNFTKRAPLFASDKMLLYPRGPRPKDLLEHLNLTVLVLLIIHSKILQMGSLSKWAQEPDPSHTDSASDIVRLRMIRNQLYHSPLCAITNEEFEKKWTTLTEVLNRLGALDDDIHGMKRCHFSQLRAQRKAYAKMIRQLFSSDRYFVQKFIENTGEHLQKKEKLEAWMNAKDQGLRQKVAFEAMGYTRAKPQKTDQQSFMPQRRLDVGNKVVCRKCSRQYSNICSDCSDRQFSFKPELSKEEKVICIECNKSIGNICSDCSSSQASSKPDLSTTENVRCTECNTPISTKCTKCSSGHAVSKLRHLFEEKMKDFD